MQRAGLLAEGLRAGAQQPQQVAVALGAVEGRAREAVAQNGRARLLEQVAELRPRLRAVDLAGRILAHPAPPPRSKRSM
jgi:hypothetical protein